MSNKTNFYGQINYTRLVEAMKSGKVAGKRIQTKNGPQVVVDINVWVHDEPRFNQDASIQCQLNKEAYEAGEPNPFYIGDLKRSTPKVQDIAPDQMAGMVDEVDDDLPF